MSQGEPVAHTPGPWKAVLLVDAWIVEGPDGRMLFGVDSDEPQAEADARLVAASLTMLEALERIMSELPMRRDWLDPELERFARASIQSARGESQ